MEHALENENNNEERVEVKEKEKTVRVKRSYIERSEKVNGLVWYIQTKSWLEQKLAENDYFIWAAEKKSYTKRVQKRHI